MSKHSSPIQFQVVNSGIANRNTPLSITSVSSYTSMDVLNRGTEFSPEESLWMTQQSACRVYDCLSRLSKRCKDLTKLVLAEDIEIDSRLYVGDDLILSVMPKAYSNTVIRRVSSNDDFEQACFTITIRQPFISNDKRIGKEKTMDLSIKKVVDKTGTWKGGRYSLSILCDPTFFSSYNSFTPNNLDTRTSEYIGKILRAPFIFLEQLLKNIDLDFEFEVPSDFKEKIHEEHKRQASYAFEGMDNKPYEHASRTSRKDVAKLKMYEQMDLSVYPEKKYDMYIRLNQLTFQFFLPVFPKELENLQKKIIKLDDVFGSHRKFGISSYLEFLCSILCWVPSRNKVWNNSPERACGLRVNIHPPMDQPLSSVVDTVNEAKECIATRSIKITKSVGTNDLYSLELTIPNRKDLISDAQLKEHFKDNEKIIEYIFQTCLQARITIHKEFLDKNFKVDSLYSLMVHFLSEELKEEPGKRPHRKTKFNTVSEETSIPGTDVVWNFVSDILDRILEGSNLKYWLSDSWTWSILTNTPEKSLNDFGLTSAERKIMDSYFDQEAHSGLLDNFKNAVLLSDEEVTLLRRPNKVLNKKQIQAKEFLEKKITVTVGSLLDKTGMNIKFDYMFHKQTYMSMAEASVKNMKDLHIMKSAVEKSGGVPKRVKEMIVELKTKVSDVFPKGRLGNHLNLVVRGNNYARMLEDTTKGSVDNSLSNDLKNFTGLLKTDSKVLSKVRMFKENGKRKY